MSGNKKENMSERKQENRLLLILSVLLFFSGVLLPEFIGFLSSDYNSMSNYLSELGAVEAEYSSFINFFGFFPVAIIALTIVLILRKRLYEYRLAELGLLLLGIGIFMGFMVSFFFPCDYGCPVEGGSLSNSIHNLNALITYLVEVTGLILLSFGLKRFPSNQTRFLVFVATFITIFGIVMILNPTQFEMKGLWQRSVEYTTFALLIFLSLNLKEQTVN